jgi:hypothetical protein
MYLAETVALLSLHEDEKIQRNVVFQGCIYAVFRMHKPFPSPKAISRPVIQSKKHGALEMVGR